MTSRYIFYTISQIFIPFFVVLFFVASVVLLISLSAATQAIKINIFDLLQLFSYAIPNAIFFVIPITFFCACVLGLSRLSYDYELLVFFSLGIAPRKILRAFVWISGFVSVVLLVFSLALIPITRSAYTSFANQKKAEVNINIKAGEFGQRLGDWLIYADEANNRHYKGLVLFSSGIENNEIFITAKEGELSNKDGVFSLSLIEGSAYFAKSDEVQKADFATMKLNSKTDDINLSSYDLLEYWSSAFEGSHTQARRLSQAIIASLFPIASIFLVLLFGVANPRFQKNLSYVYLLVSVSIYFIAMHILSQNAPFVGIFALPLVWFALSYVLYRRFVATRY
ncbi:LptF/LptG family permease [Helicobacter sp. T3_23-1059]